MDLSQSVPLLAALNFNIGIFVVMIILVLFSGFFSMTETVFNTCNTVKLTLLAEEGKKTAQKALWISERFDRTITTILVGNNIVNISLATIAVTFFAGLILNEAYVELTSTAVITIVVLIFGEILPKTLGKTYADTLALKLAYPIYFFMIILFPLVIIFMGLQKLIHGKDKDKEPQVNEAELEAILDTMEDEGAIESEEVELINNILDLNDRTVKDIMTPRPDVIAISDDLDNDEIKDVLFEYKFSRIPVYHEDKDNIIGVLYERDFLSMYIRRKNFRFKSLLKPAKFVSASMKVDDVIHEFKKDKTHLAVVSGEYGEVIGIVTMEDALEELVGEIYDEHDESTEEELITKINDNEYLLDASIYLEDLFEELNIGRAPETQYSKLSGWLYGNCEDVPEEGYNYTYISKFIQKDEDEEYLEMTKKLTFVISKVEERRIISVKLYIEDVLEEDLKDKEDEKED